MSDLQRLHALFDELLEVPAERWEEWFAAHRIDTATRAKLERLAAADRNGVGMLDDTLGGYARSLATDTATEPALARVSESDAGGSSDPIGRRIGPFRLRQRLGQGGMATVFLAVREDADFEQTVALKLLRRDAFSELDLALFRRERQVLARLTHPNIARLIDGGVTEDGVPYLAMEHVDGVTITHWCREQALGLRERIALLAKVARAVAAAHSALIVHRDIKPSNVLVGRDGEPKLLDFGIAKLLHADEADTTRGGVTPMTPEYAAPEQFSGGAITTATDVYALGVLMYELLTGVRPTRRALKAPSAQLAAARAEGASTSTATRRVRGDLDKVVLMALAEEPARRYVGAAAFADDLDRHLANLPVVAHPPSAWYRTRKFVQRHRGGVLVTALLVLGILASLAAAVWQATQARAQANRAERVSEFLIELFEAAEQSLPREQRPTPEILVREAATRLDADTSLDSTSRATLLAALADVSQLAGEYARALQLADRAIDGFDPDARATTRLRLGVEVGRAETLWIMGRAKEGLAALAPKRKQIVAQADEVGVEGLMTLAALEMATGAIDPAIASAHEAATLAARVYGKDDRDALIVELFVGDLLSNVARHAEAVVRLQPVLARWRALGLPPDKDYVNSFQNLGSSWIAIGEVTRGEEQLTQSLALLRQIHTAPHHKIAAALQNLGGAKSMRGRGDEALPLLEEAARMYEAIFGPDHMEVASALDAIGAVQIGQREYEAATASLTRATDICTQGKHDADPACGRIWQNLSYTFLQRKLLPEAEAANARSLALRAALYGEAHPQYALALSGLGGIRVAQQRHDEALDLFRRALVILDAAGQGSGAGAARVQGSIARTLRELGREEAALTALERAEALQQRNAPDDKTWQLKLLLLRIDVLVALDRRDAARIVARRALEGGYAADILSETEWARVREAAVD